MIVGQPDASLRLHDSDDAELVWGIDSTTRSMRWRLRTPALVQLFNAEGIDAE